MKIEHTLIKGLYQITPNIFEDDRGCFVKNINASFFKKNNLKYSFEESYYSISYKNTIRGMHFQIPPFAHSKLVYVVHGQILDVVLDLRVNSKTYGKYCEFEISDKNKTILYIPEGLAHGFKTLSDSATIIYNVTTVYSKEHDKGIKYNSFGMNWNVNNPIISERDENFPNFSDFVTPFIS